MLNFPAAFLVGGDKCMLIDSTYGFDAEGYPKALENYAEGFYLPASLSTYSESIAILLSEQTDNFHLYLSPDFRCEFSKNEGFWCVVLDCRVPTVAIRKQVLKGKFSKIEESFTKIAEVVDSTIESFLKQRPRECVN